MFGPELPVGLLFCFTFSSPAILALRQHKALLGYLRLQGLEPKLLRLQIVPPPAPPSAVRPASPAWPAP